MTDIEQTLFAIAKDGAREHQLRHAETCLAEAKDLLHDAHGQFYLGAPMNDMLLLERVKYARELVEKALDMIREAR